jgi:hypothetical protein
MEGRNRNSHWTARGKKTHDMEYKLGSKILAQNEEIANLKKKRLVRKIEAENAQIKLEIKVSSVRTPILATHPCFII